MNRSDNRKLMVTSPVSLYDLRLASSASSLKFTWSLPWRSTLLLLTFLILSLVCGALWSSAITPNVVMSNITISFDVPYIQSVNFSDNALFGTAAGSRTGDCPWQATKYQWQLGSGVYGSFHYCLNSEVYVAQFRRSHIPIRVQSHSMPREARPESLLLYWPQLRCWVHRRSQPARRCGKPLGVYLRRSRALFHGGLYVQRDQRIGSAVMMDPIR
ncbi:hypothetical protein F5Y04DRAFT_292365 [Hypomontagnella monticulosa]|nr:hypothetical protein F5Y04DRAFT_292365 [Hypomontagnella monticulosa]